MTKEQELREMLSQCFNGEDLEKVVKRIINNDHVPTKTEKKMKELYENLKRAGAFDFQK